MSDNLLEELENNATLKLNAAVDQRSQRLRSRSGATFHARIVCETQVPYLKSWGVVGNGLAKSTMGFLITDPNRRPLAQWHCMDSLSLMQQAEASYYPSID